MLGLERGEAAHNAASAGLIRESSVERAGKRLKGDLDNIVSMAKRKEPERSYQSVEQLSEDIRRHLESLPVMARQDGVNYRLVKPYGAIGLGSQVVCSRPLC